MEFKFSVGDKIKEAWPLYKENFGMFILMVIISFVTQSLGNEKHLFLAFVSFIVSILVSYVWIRSIINLVDKKEFKPFEKESFPSISQYWNFLKTVFLSTLVIIVGVIFLIIPGLYLSGRLMFASYISVEKNQGARKSIRESWDMTKDFGWKIFGKGLLVGLFILAGLIALFFGVFITYPIGVIVLVMLYREFSKFKNGTNSIPELTAVPEMPKPEVKEEVITGEVK